ncbi:hypothetical protein ACP4OV_019737 [Aristida adscensionis]
MSQRQGRHQRRASQSVFVLPENFALEDVPAAVADGGVEQRKPAAADASEQSARQAGRHRRAMSMAVASRDLEMITEDIGSYKY